jgi:hypothetical protein
MKSSIRHSTVIVSCMLAVACNSVLGIEEAKGISEDDDQEMGSLLDPTGPGQGGTGSSLNQSVSANSCAQAEMLCGGECVPTHHPRYGCGTECGEPCSLPNVATYTCEQKACAIYKCAEGWKDCNYDPEDGCETELGTPQDCGACGDACPKERPTCVRGVCRDLSEKTGPEK